MNDQPRTPWEELGIPRGNWIEICLTMGVYTNPKIQVRMPYPRHTETEWVTVETIRKSNASQVEKLWDQCIGWDCCVRMLGLRGEVVRESWPVRPFGSP